MIRPSANVTRVPPLAQPKTPLPYCGEFASQLTPR